MNNKKTTFFSIAVFSIFAAAATLVIRAGDSAPAFISLGDGAFSTSNRLISCFDFEKQQSFYSFNANCEGEDLDKPGSTEVSRDTERKADINTIQDGLETYFIDNGYYPDYFDVTSLAASLGDLDVEILTDPWNFKLNDPVGNYAYYERGCMGVCYGYSLLSFFLESEDNGYIKTGLTATGIDKTAEERDEERVDDIFSTHTQLELFYSDNGYYPGLDWFMDDRDPRTILPGIDLQTLLSPESFAINEAPDIGYNYETVPADCYRGCGATSYILSAPLETKDDDIIRDSLN